MTQRDLPGQIPRQIPRQTGPIFIGGAGRSGTTLMRALLDAHPRICCGPELKALPEISGLYRSFAAASSPVQQAYGNTLADIRSYFQEFIERLVGKYRRASGKPRWGEKTPHNLLCMLMLGEIFPDARFIHMIRDGRDVACSLVKMDWTDAGTGQKLGYCQNIRNAARYWRDLVRFGQQQAAHPTLEPAKE